MVAAHYTSNKPHHKNGWYVWAYTALQINDNSKRHHVASIWEGIFPWHTEGESGSVFFVPSRLLNEMLPLCTLWVQLFNRLQLARLVTGWTTVTKEYRLKCWGLLERGLLVVISRALSVLFNVCMNDLKWETYFQEKFIKHCFSI